MKFLVTVQREIIHSGVITVEAATKEEARVKAKAQAREHVLPHKYPTEYTVLRVDTVG